jgi:hypothetical protein
MHRWRGSCHNRNVVRTGETWNDGLRCGRKACRPEFFEVGGYASRDGFVNVRRVSSIYAYNDYWPVWPSIMDTIYKNARLVFAGTV